MTKKRYIGAGIKDAMSALHLRKDVYEKQAKINQIDNYLTCWHHVARQKAMRNLLKKLITTPKNELALDLGCGDGWYTEMLIELGLQVIGLDISISRLTRAKKRFRVADFVLADASHLPFYEQAFDLIMAAQFLEHMERPNHVVTVLSKPLKSGGRLIIETPCRTNLVDQLIEKLLRKSVDWGLTIDPTHKHFFSLDQLKQIVNSSNLSIETIQGSINFNYTLPFISHIVWHKRRSWFILDVSNKLLKLLKNDWGAIIITVAKKVRMSPKVEKTVDRKTRLRFWKGH